MRYSRKAPCNHTGDMLLARKIRRTDEKRNTEEVQAREKYASGNNVTRGKYRNADDAKTSHRSIDTRIKKNLV